MILVSTTFLMSFTSHQLCSGRESSLKYNQVFSGVHVCHATSPQIKTCLLLDIFAWKRDSLCVTCMQKIGNNFFWYHFCPDFCHRSNAITLSIWLWDTTVSLFRVGYSISYMTVKQEVILTPRIQWQVLLHSPVPSCWMTRFFCQIQRKTLRRTN